MSSTPDEAGPDVISDEELQKLLIGELKPHNAPSTLVEYDLSWPRLFACEADRIRVVLGDTALRIEHVGSTSVPGLAAKPIIDILLVVASSADESSYVPNLEAAGYVLRIREPEWFEHRLFKGPDTNINLHVFSVGAAEIDRMLRFRDWLRATDADRDYYARVKRDLAQRTWRHVQHYADAKTAVVQEITERATPRQRAVTARDHSDQPMTENVMVRAARREDLSAVRELERAAGAAFRDLDMAAVADDEPPTITELVAFQDDGRAWVITNDADRPVAYLRLDVVDGNAHVEQVSVHPDHARQGLGKTLLDTAAAWAQQHGLAALTLTTYANVAWNAPYYERLGFRIMTEDQITDGSAASANMNRLVASPRGPASPCAARSAARGSPAAEQLCGLACGHERHGRFAGTVLWVRAGNEQAQRLYCADGWQLDGHRHQEYVGRAGDEVRCRHALS